MSYVFYTAFQHWHPILLSLNNTIMEGRMQEDSASIQRSKPHRRQELDTLEGGGQIACSLFILSLPHFIRFQKKTIKK